MTNLHTINVHVEYSTHNVQPVLHEIQHALHQLLTDGTSTHIDLMSLPFSPQEFNELLTFLGKGEVEATLHSLGDSMFWETRYAGVWVVEHYNANQELTSRHVEINWIPEMLTAYREDVQASMEQLQSQLENTY